MNKANALNQKFCNDPNKPHEDFVISQDQNGYFHLSIFGEPAYRQRYKSVQHFQNGWAWVQSPNGKWKMIDKCGLEVHGPTNLTVQYR